MILRWLGRFLRGLALRRRGPEREALYLFGEELIALDAIPIPQPASSR